MKTVGEELLSRLKSKNILKRKPHLKLMPNHFKPVIAPKKYWNSKVQGTAICDGNGWYKTRT